MSTPETITIEHLPIDKIKTDPRAQFRVELKQDTVDNYAALLKEGTAFPAVDVFADAETGDHILADGFHRIAAAKQAAMSSFPARLHAGNLRDAVLFSLGANREHGLYRSNDDKRKAVVFCLRDPELHQKPQREIARLCGVTQAMVSKVHNELYPKLKKSKDEGALDNGYQMPDSPGALLAHLTDEERGQVFSALVARKETMYGEPELAKRLQQLGIATTYGEDKYSRRVEWTPLADAVQEALLGGDAWSGFEMELFRANRERESRHYLSRFGLVKPLLEQLHSAAGWVLWDDLERGAEGWCELLVEHGEVLRHEIEVRQYDKRRFYHITMQGCVRLGLPIGLPIRTPPTKEALAEQDRIESEARRKEAAEREAARLAALDPAKEADDERRRLIQGNGYSGLSYVRSTAETCKWLDVTAITPLLDQLEAAIQALPLKPLHVKPADTSPAAEPASEGFRFAIGETVRMSHGEEGRIAERHQNGAGEAFYQIEGKRFRHFAERELTKVEGEAVEA